jgi:hypothetical protein
MRCNCFGQFFLFLGTSILTIQYVKITCDVVFTNSTPENTQPYPFTFFVCLEMEMRTVLNSNGTDIQLTTFFGPHDWANSNDQMVLNPIWDHPRSLRKPFYLIPPTIIDANADVQIQIKNALMLSKL